jgi:hypothetical protein
MTKQKTIMLAAVGAALVAASQAQAQFGYAPDSLLLNFRDTANITANDVEVNMGNIGAVAAFQGTEVVVPAGFLQSVYGASLPAIGFSAAAGDQPFSGGTLWLTRADSAAGVPAGSPPAQNAVSVVNPVLNKVNNIGLGANGSGSQGVLPTGFATALVPGGTSGNNYQAQGEANTTAGGQQTINYGAALSLQASKGGLIESIQNGTGVVFEDLWSQTATGGAASAALGYFTFLPNGEVDYTSFTVAAVPEPATYGMIAALALGALAVRRQLRSLAV